jgi:hypothetical protein
MNSSEKSLVLVEYEGQQFLQQGDNLYPAVLSDALDVHKAPGVEPFYSDGTTYVRVKDGKASPVTAADVQKVIENSAEYEQKATAQREADYKAAEERQAERVAKIAKLTPSPE